MYWHTLYANNCLFCTYASSSPLCVVADAALAGVGLLLAARAARSATAVVENYVEAVLSEALDFIQRRQNQD